MLKLTARFACGAAMLLAGCCLLVLLLRSRSGPTRTPPDLPWPAVTGWPAKVTGYLMASGLIVVGAVLLTSALGLWG